MPLPDLGFGSEFEGWMECLRVSGYRACWVYPPKLWIGRSRLALRGLEAVRRKRVTHFPRAAGEFRAGELVSRLPYLEVMRRWKPGELLGGVLPAEIPGQQRLGLIAGATPP